MASLEEKQAYYTYSTSGYVYKQPPVLDASLVEEMGRFGRDAHGDPLFRFVWAGVVIVRSEPQEDHGRLFGDEAGTMVKGGRRVCRYLHVKAKALLGFAYTDADGEYRLVSRPEDVPDGTVFIEEWEYSDFGKLRWYLMRKLTPEQLAETELYDEADIPPTGDYVCVSKGPLQTPEGWYLEPTTADLPLIAKYLYEERHESLSDLLAADSERVAEAAKARAAKSLDEMAGMVDDALRAPRPARGKKFGPAKQPPVFTGDIIPVWQPQSQK